MDKLKFNPKLVGALALGILAGTALVVLLSGKNRKTLPEQISKDTKNLAKKLSKKAKKKAKNLQKEEWLAEERDKIMKLIK